MRNLIIAREENGDAVWVGDGLTRRHIQDAKELEGLRFWIQQRGGDNTVQVFADLRVLGTDAEAAPPPAQVELDYDRFVKDVVDRLATRLTTLRFDVDAASGQ